MDRHTVVDMVAQVDSCSTWYEVPVIQSSIST